MFEKSAYDEGFEQGYEDFLKEAEGKAGIFRRGYEGIKGAGRYVGGKAKEGAQGGYNLGKKGLGGYGGAGRLAVGAGLGGGGTYAATRKRK